MNLKERIEEVKKNYNSLDKMTSDNGEFVIIAEKNEGGSYEEYKECLGVKENGDLIWSYLSGCSCNGGNEEKKVTDVTAKIFNIEEDKTVEDFFENNKCEPYQGTYQSY